MSHEVGELFEQPVEMRGLWRIPDFPSLLHIKGCIYFSPKFLFLNCSWQWRIYYGGKDWIELYLFQLSDHSPKKVYFSVSIKNASGKEEKRVESNTFPRTLLAWNVPQFLKRSDLQNRRTELAPSDVLTISYTLKSVTSEGVSRETQREDIGYKGVSRETQTEDTGYKDTFSLSEHLKNLLLSGDGHDVLLKVGDKEFRAHKNILKVRSPVFAAMFTNDMAENAENSVTIEDCDPDAFGDFLQFVYSGAVDITSVSRALRLYYVADKYDYPKLKEMCVHFMKISFTTSTVFEVLQLAARHDEKELQQQAIVYFANNLEEVIITVEWQRFITANPIQGNEMSLKALQCLKSSLNKK